MKKYTYFGWTPTGEVLEMFALFSDVEPAPAQVKEFQRRMMAAQRVVQMPSAAFVLAQELKAMPEEAATPTPPSALVGPRGESID